MYNSFVAAPIYCGRRCRFWVAVTGAGIVIWNVAEASAEFDDGLAGDVDPPDEPLAPPEERVADGMVPPPPPPHAESAIDAAADKTIKYRIHHSPEQNASLGLCSGTNGATIGHLA
jgi:hypothetical protein